MNYRINTKMVVFVGLLVLIAGGLFVYTLISAPHKTVTTPEDVPLAEPSEERMIIARHQFREGIHTIAGNADVPTTCHRLVTEPFFIQGELTGVEIRFNTLLEGDDCPSESFQVPFRATFEAPENTQLTATWNGTPARLNLVPVGPNETIEDEMYIKG